jgi:preprotein translocase subunit SecY|tara:strand:- start:421 stop:642 length:222 start_codon:yes stop_codon:yes gene_type:complete
MKELMRMLKEDKVLRLTVAITLGLTVFITGGLLFYPQILRWGFVAILLVFLVIAVGGLIYLFIDELLDENRWN